MSIQSIILTAGDIIKTDESIHVAGSFGPFLILEQTQNPALPPNDRDKTILNKHFIVVGARKSGAIVFNDPRSEPEYQEVTAYESDSDGKPVADGLCVKFYQSGNTDRVPYRNLVEQPIVVGKGKIDRPLSHKYDW